MKSIQFFILAILSTLCTLAPGLTLPDQAQLGNNAKNYIVSAGGENGRAGWITYNDAAGVAPVDCTGGSPSVTWTTSATTPLTGAYSFLWTHPASNRQGDGASYFFTADKSDSGTLPKTLSISFDWNISSGTFQTGIQPIGGLTLQDSDVEVYIYDTTNSALVPVSNQYLVGGTAGRYQATFPVTQNAATYRLCLHGATTNTSAFVMQVDNVRVGPQPQVTVPPASDWTKISFTLGGSGSAPTLGTIAIKDAYWRRVADSMELYYEIKQTSNGTDGAGTYLFPLPGGYSIDTNKITLAENGPPYASVGEGTYYVGSGTSATYPGIVQPYNSTNLQLLLYGTATSNGTFGSGFAGVAPSGTLYVGVHATVPILGWGSNVTASADSDSRAIAAVATGASGTIADSTTLTVPVSSVSKDTHGGFSNVGTTSFKWTAPYPGWYIVSGYTTIINPSSNTSGYIQQCGVLVNGASIGTMQQAQTGAVNFAVSCPYSAVTYLNAGDTVAPFNRQNSGSTRSYNDAYFSIGRLGGSTFLAASDAVAARYTASGTLSLTSSDVQINYDTKDYDLTGSVTTGASWKFTAPIAGRYHVSAAAETSNTGCTTTTSHFTLSIYKNNGSRYETLDDRICGITTSYRKVLAGSRDIYLLPGDFIDVRMACGDGTTHSQVQFSVDNSTSIEIHRVGN